MKNEFLAYSNFCIFTNHLLIFKTCIQFFFQSNTFQNQVFDKKFNDFLNHKYHFNVTRRVCWLRDFQLPRNSQKYRERDAFHYFFDFCMYYFKWKIITLKCFFLCLVLCFFVWFRAKYINIYFIFMKNIVNIKLYVF